MHPTAPGRAPCSPRRLAEPIRIDNDWFTPPDVSGHGIVFDRHTLAAHVADATVVSLLVFVRPNEADLAAASVPEFLNSRATATASKPGA
jgi:hypothetical protein